MRFFFDTCISSRIVAALAILAEPQGVSVVHYSLKFDDPSIDDTIWIPELADDGDWIIVSADPRIARGVATKKAWKESGLTAFFLDDGFSGLTFWPQVQEIMHWWPVIVRYSRKAKQGSGYRLPRKGGEKAIQEIY